MYRRQVHGKRLRLLREEADLPRRDLAAAIGCSTGHLKNIELEVGAPTRHQPSGELVFRIIRVLADRLGRPVDLDEFSDPIDAKDAA